MQEIGPYIISSHEEGEFQLAIEACLRQLVQAHRLPLNDITEIAIKNVASERVQEIKNKLRMEGSPEKIKNLFDLKKKNEVKKFIKAISISNGDIARMVSNCHLVGFHHSRKHKWFYPDDVIHTDDESEKHFKKKLKSDLLLIRVLKNMSKNCLNR